MEHMPSPSVAERNQRRKAEFIPPAWPLILLVAIIVAAVVIAR